MSDLQSGTVALLLFPLFWVLVSGFLGYVGGWQSLAEIYREQRPFEGQRWWLQSGRMRWAMSYNNCLTVGANSEGLHVSVLFLFRAGHSPLFIRWEDVTVQTRTFLFVRRCRFQFRAAPGVFLDIRASLADKLRAQAGQAWPLRPLELM
jgi:hypothetical protein